MHGFPISVFRRSHLARSPERAAAAAGSASRSSNRDDARRRAAPRCALRAARCSLLTRVSGLPPPIIRLGAANEHEHA
jgi:hypothetical protein